MTKVVLIIRQFIKLLCLLVLYLFVFAMVADAQKSPDALIHSAIRNYQQTHPGKLLYVVTDKDFYKPGETLWLAGYLLDRWRMADSLAPDILSVALKRVADSAIVLTKNFIIQNGIAAGNCYLPDSLPAGIYEFLAFTNLVSKSGVPQQVYCSKIVIRATGKESVLTMHEGPAKDSVSITFYPEGGDLVNGLESRVGLEMKSEGHPLTEKAVLLVNGAPTDTISTNQYGLGVFSLRPIEGVEYAVKLLNSKTSRSYPLPPALKQGATIELVGGGIGRLLQIRVQSSSTANYKIIARHILSNDVVITAPFEVRKEQMINFGLGDQPAGLISLTLTDETGRPVAERLIFGNKEQIPDLKIRTNKEVYGRRDSIQLTISMADNTQVVKGLATVSVVHLSRLDTLHKKNIAAWFYLRHWLGEDAALELAGNAPGIDTLLLVKGWRRYTWQNAMKYSSTADPVNFRKARIAGQVVAMEGKVKKPVVLMVSRDSLRGLLQTDQEGFFYPSAKDIVVSDGRTLVIKPISQGMSSGGYKAAVTLPTKELLARMPISGDHFQISTDTTWSKQVDTLEEDLLAVKQLATVIVKSRSSAMNKTGPPGANDCGDYVCISSILNCPRHLASDPDSRQPITGNFYLLEIGNMPDVTRVRMRYDGCILDGIRQETIYTARQFYGMDKDMLADKDQKQLLTTIYWNPVINMDIATGSGIEFYTSDLLGQYLITVQGRTATGSVFYTDKMITVKAN